MRKLIALLAIAVVGVGLYFLLRPTEEDKIKETLSEFQQLVRIDANENALQVAGKVQGIADIFTDPFQIEFKSAVTKPIVLIDKKELKSRVMQGRAFLKRLKLSFSDTEIAFSGEDKALVTLTAVVRGRGARSEQDFEEASEFEIELQKLEDGSWKLHRLKNVQALEFR